MRSTTLIRLLGVPLAANALGLLFTAAPVRAGGGEIPTGPSISPSAPRLALDGAGGIVVALDLTCWAEAAAEQAHVDIAVSLGQGRASGGAALSATCVDGTQTLTLAVSSATGRDFHPGPVTGIIEIEAQTSNGYGHAAAPLDVRLLPAPASR